MSNLYNDMVYDDIAEVRDDLTPEQLADVDKLLASNELEEARYMALYYAKQNGKADIHAIMDANVHKDIPGGLSVF